MVDTIASLGTMPFEMDAWGVDVSVTGAQKGLMVPPGLSFVAAGPKAKAAHETAGLRTRYWDWTFREGPVHYQKYCGTPPEHMLFGLRKALDMLLDEGLENAFERHRLLADATRAAVAAWARGRCAGVQHYRSGGARQLGHDDPDLRRQQPAADHRLLPRHLRRRARHRHFGARRQGHPHRAYGPCERAHGARHVRAAETTLKALGVPHGPVSKRRRARSGRRSNLRASTPASERSQSSTDKFVMRGLDPRISRAPTHA